MTEIKIGMVIQVIEKYISRGQTRPYLKRTGHQRPPNFLDPLTTRKRFDLERPDLVR